MAKPTPAPTNANHGKVVVEKYKNKAIKIINENPYKLAEDIRGIGFKIADSNNNLNLNK